MQAMKNAGARVFCRRASMTGSVMSSMNVRRLAHESATVGADRYAIVIAICKAASLQKLATAVAFQSKVALQVMRLRTRKLRWLAERVDSLAFSLRDGTDDRDEGPVTISASCLAPDCFTVRCSSIVEIECRAKIGNLRIVERSRCARAQQQKQFRGLLELLHRVNRRFERSPRHDRPVIGEEHGGVLTRKSPNRIGHRGVAGAKVRNQWKLADLHDEISGQRWNAFVGLQSGHARHGCRMRRVQMNDRTGADALFIHGTMQRRFLRRLVAGQEIAAPVELSEARRIDRSQARVRRRQEPAVVEPHADVPAASGGEPALEHRFAKSDDRFAQAMLVALRRDFCHANRSHADKKKSGLPKLPDFNASASGLSRPMVTVHGTPGSISGPI